MNYEQMMLILLFFFFSINSKKRLQSQKLWICLQSHLKQREKLLVIEFEKLILGIILRIETPFPFSGLSLGTKHHLKSL